MKQKSTLVISLLLVMSLVGCTTAPATTSASPAASQTGVVKLDGQKWINSDLLGSVTAATTADPTDDFNIAVNKDWMVNLKPDPSHAENQTSIDHEDAVKAQVGELLKSDKPTGHDAQTAALYYKTLTDMDARNALGVEPIRPQIEKILAIKSLDDLTAYLSDPDIVIGTKLCKLTSAADTKDSAKYVVSLSPDTLALDDAANYAADSQAGKARSAAGEAFFTKIMARFGIKESEAKERYAAMIAFETKLASGEAAKAELYTAEYMSSSYNPTSADALQKAAGAYPIAAVLKPYTDAGFTNFSLAQPKWLAKLSELYTADNVEAMKDLLLMNVLSTVSTYLDQDCLDMFNERASASLGTKMEFGADALAYRAVALDSNNNGTAPQFLCWAVGKLYAENYVSADTKSEMTAFVKKIVAVYRNRLQNNTWLSDTTKQKAIEKLDALRIRVAYPDDWSKYTMADFDLKTAAEGGNAIADLAAVNKYAAALEVKKVTQPVDKDVWGMYPQMVGASYEPSDNSINIPAASLTGCYYKPEWSDAQKMGALGCVVGHEITHAFDSMGSQYDKDGNMSNWWTQEDAAAFKQRTDKVSAYYSTMEPFEGEYVNGDLTVGETVADLGGMSCMLEMAKTMKDFDYKAFFSSWASIWGYQASEMVCRTMLSYDPHAPKYLRTNVTVQQFPEFYDAYGVKEGDNMYLAPADRLSVW